MKERIVANLPNTFPWMKTIHYFDTIGSTNDEARRMAKSGAPHGTVLIAGHHGSAYSTADELLAVTKPDYVFISAGRDNIYGHPAPALLKRLREHGCNIYRTDENGSIIYRR